MSIARTAAATLGIGALALLPGGASGQSASDFTDWTAASANVASGTLHGTPVSLSGTNVSDSPGSRLDGTSQVFNRPEFTPPLSSSDAIHFVGSSGNSYTLQFGSAVTDPVLHLGSLASTLHFPTGTQVTELSGDAEFGVSESDVVGGLDGSDDANGSVRLTGSFTSVSFSTTFAGSDGIYLQVGKPAPPPPPPPPPAQVNNTKKPTISYDGKEANGLGRYRCNPGTWEGLGADATFTYAWYRVRIDGSQTSWSKVADGRTFVLPKADEGGRFSCAEVTRDPSGNVVWAMSDDAILTGSPEVQLVSGTYGDFRIRGIDVFQVVQPTSGSPTFGFPSGSFGGMCGGGTPSPFRTESGCNAPADPQLAWYEGVPLDAGKRATAMVYVDMATAATSYPDQPLDVTLYGYIDHKRQPEEFTKSITNRPVSPTPYVTADERATKGTAVSFAIPATWRAQAGTGKQLDLEARVKVGISSVNTTMAECLRGRGFGLPTPGCAANNRYTLVSPEFYDDFPKLTIATLPLTKTPSQSLWAPSLTLSAARDVYPGGGGFVVRPYMSSFSIEGVESIQATDDRCDDLWSDEDEKTTGADRAAAVQRITRSCRMAFVNARISLWHLKTVFSQKLDYNLLMAVHNYDDGSGSAEPGWKQAGTDPQATVYGSHVPTIVVNDGSAGRSLTAAGHEFGHALGFPHADGGGVGKRYGCGGELESAGGSEEWLYDYRGRLQGIGTRIRSYFGGTTTVTLLPDVKTWTVGGDNATGSMYDLMSYCTGGNDSIAWLSARNWNHAFDSIRRATAASSAHSATVASQARAHSAQQGKDVAIGAAGPGGASIDTVLPGDKGVVSPDPEPSSPLRLRAYDGTGNLLAEVGARLEAIHNAPGVYSWVAAIPDGAARLEAIGLGGAELDRLERSKPPRLKLSAPSHGASVTAKRSLPVRWTAKDPDGDKLNVTVEWSYDRGRSWAIVYDGPSRGKARVPGRFLPAAAKGRIRVTVSDGFNSVRKVSGPVRSTGRPPAAEIITPADGEGAQAGKVLLVGQARDDHDRRLTGRKLTWYAGTRRLGTGERLKAKLPAGRRVKLRLVARAGRLTGTATRTIPVDPVAFRVNELTAPERVARKAKRVSIKVATTAPGTLTAGGKRFRVGKKTRTLKAPLPKKPASGLLKLKVKLVAKGIKQPTLKTTLLIFRR